MVNDVLSKCEELDCEIFKHNNGCLIGITFPKNRAGKYMREKIIKMTIEGYDGTQYDIGYDESDPYKIAMCPDYRYKVRDTIKDNIDDYDMMAKELKKYPCVGRAFISIQSKDILTVSFVDDAIGCHIFYYLEAYVDNEDDLIIHQDQKDERIIYIKSKQAIETQERRKWCKEEYAIKKFNELFDIDC